MQLDPRILWIEGIASCWLKLSIFVDPARPKPVRSKIDGVTERNVQEHSQGVVSPAGLHPDDVSVFGIVAGQVGFHFRVWPYGRPWWPRYAKGQFPFNSWERFSKYGL